nr:MAG: hypothetical protein [Bacteriophage sp.]
MNTRITYLYRDASNWKKYNEVVVSGTFTADQISEIVGCLNDGEYFIPKQVGFPEIRFEKITEDDHCWFELCENDFEVVEAEPTIAMTAGEVLEKFKAAKGNWNDSDTVKADDNTSMALRGQSFFGVEPALKIESEIRTTFYRGIGTLRSTQRSWWGNKR